MSLFDKKAQEPMGLDEVMKKYDRESNVRIWEGKPRIAVNLILATFSVFCLCVTLFASWLEELRLTTFVAWIVLLGYLVFPAKKGRQRVNYIPWYDLVLMTLGTAAFLYYAFNAKSIIQQGSIFANYQIVIGIVFYSDDVLYSGRCSRRFKFCVNHGLHLFCRFFYRIGNFVLKKLFRRIVEFSLKNRKLLHLAAVV